MKTIVQKGNMSLLSLTVALLLAATASAQTYSTVAGGNWSDPSTWAGGQVPGTSITAGKKVNISHAVTFDVNSDIIINGILNITDTLKYAANAQKSIRVNSGGVLYVTNGVLMQNVTIKQSNIEVAGGRMAVTSSTVFVGKDFKASNGGKRSFVNSVVLTGEGYSIEGSQSVDTIRNSLIETGMSGSGGDFIITGGKLRVANANVKVHNGQNFKNMSGGTIQVLLGAASNYGFDFLKVTGDLENNANWDARIDAYCVNGNIKGGQMAAIDITRSEDCEAAHIGDAPELVFKNPVLKSGSANKQGAVYRFSNVLTGIDAEIKLKKFSRSDIKVESIDLPNEGWDKAFQPKFGLNGKVAANQNWYIDFELKFFIAGTNDVVKVPKVDITALDVDGDGSSIKEYVVFQAPSNVIYSTLTYLTEKPAGSPSQSLFCPVDGLLSPLLGCIACGGDGKTGTWNLDDCGLCNGTGKLFSLCNHAWDETHGNTVQGPVDNFASIDTSATQVMATYQYSDVKVINFRFGASTGNKSSNGAGIRLNSLWFRRFSLSPPSILPVKLADFNAQLEKNNVMLSWKGFEEDFSHYILQRSIDGREYKDVAIILPSNNGNQWNEYKYKDANVSSPGGILFYRLQLVDKVQEGTKYSDIRVIRLSKDNEMDLMVYPNPVVNELRLTQPSSWQGKPSVIELFSANGSRVSSTQIGNSNQTETMDLSRYPKGVYFIRITCNGQTAQQRVVKN